MLRRLRAESIDVTQVKCGAQVTVKNQKNMFFLLLLLAGTTDLTSMDSTLSVVSFFSKNVIMVGPGPSALLNPQDGCGRHNATRSTVVTPYLLLVY